MKNPLRHRYLRSLKADIGKYIALFLFITLFIGASSAFFITNDSVMRTYKEGQAKFNMEDGHLSFNMLPDESVLSRLESENSLKFSPLYYKEETMAETGNTIRIYAVRNDLNKEFLHEGSLPSDGQIIIDRMYAANNNITVGSTVTIDSKSFVVSGLYAVPDYSCLYYDNSDMMFDSVNFGIAEVTSADFDSINEARLSYNYAYKYNTPLKDDIDANERSEKLISSLEAVLTDFDESFAQNKLNDLKKQAEEISNSLTSHLASMSKELAPKMTLAQIGGGFISTSIAARWLNVSEEQYIQAKDALDELKSMESKISSFDSFSSIDLQNADENSFDTEEIKNAIDEFSSALEKLNGSGLYDCSALLDDTKKLSELLNTEFENELLNISDYNPAYTNKAITFVAEDGESDKASMQLMMYMIIAIIAFIFAVTMSAQINAEAGVIGTLRASGYSRLELVGHYMILPLLVTLSACLVGNMLAYTAFVQLFVKVYYSNYSLFGYENFFNLSALLETTVAPAVLTAAITFVVLFLRLKAPVLNFLRGEMKKKRKSKVIKLPPKMAIFHKFRLRIFLDNIPSYLILFVGIVMAGALLVFGLMFEPLMYDYSDLVKESKISSYQYVLTAQEETAISGAEKYCVESLNTNSEKFVTDEVLIYGIEENSAYIKSPIPQGQVLISNSMADKFNLKPGSSVTLKEPYGNKEYSFTVGGVYRYDAALSLFLNRADWLNTFEKDDDYFTGYFSNVELTDIDSNRIYSVITEEDLTKIVTQLGSSMLEFMSIFKALGIVLFLLIMYVLTKLIIDRNAFSISMSRVLGYGPGEIGRLYILITSIVALLSLVAAVPIVNAFLKWAFHSYLYTEMSGYIPYIVSPKCFVEMILLGVASYCAVSAILLFKLRKIKPANALKQ